MPYRRRRGGTWGSDSKGCATIFMGIVRSSKIRSIVIGFGFKRTVSSLGSQRSHRG